MKGSVLETVGSPLVRVSSPPGSIVAAKLEAKNPGGSAKDRPALYMIEAAERDGLLGPDGHLVEPTSGNTGIGLALAAAVKGYDLTIVMPEAKSPERRRIMAAYGADIELVPGDISDAIDRADELEAERGWVQLGQFENEANVRSHYETTAEEVLDAVGDRTVDAFVATVGTGGTLTGTARRLREEFPDVEVVAVEPEKNPVLSTGESGEDEFQGMGPGFVSDILDVEVIDAVETVALPDAEAECRRLAREEGILAGQSSGAAMIAARRVAERLADPSLDCPEAPDRAARLTEDGGPVADGGDDATPGDPDCPLVVTLFPDHGERYMSTGMFDAPD
jgi:cysteine synthase A